MMLELMGNHIKTFNIQDGWCIGQFRYASREGVNVRIYMNDKKLIEDSG